VNGLTATVDFWGVRKEIRLEVVDEPLQPGDYILNHVGYAIRRIPAEEVGGTLALYEELLARADEEDLMAADVRGEIEGAADAGE
jgi:hydrogenase expression/formation protein HypC